MWISVLVDNEAVDELIEQDGGPQVYELAITHPGTLSTDFYPVHELNLESPKTGLPK